MAAPAADGNSSALIVTPWPRFTEDLVVVGGLREMEQVMEVIHAAQPAPGDRPGPGTESPVILRAPRHLLP